MVVVSQTVVEKLLAYLNQEITLSSLVDWAKNTIVHGQLEPTEDVEMLENILTYLAAVDATHTLLNWNICADFLDKVGVKLQIITLPDTEK